MKKKVIKVTACIALVTLLIAGCGVESESIVPWLIMGISAGYLALVGYANNWFSRW